MSSRIRCIARPCMQSDISSPLDGRCYDFSILHPNSCSLTLDVEFKATKHPLTGVYGFLAVSCAQGIESQRIGGSETSLAYAGIGRHWQRVHRTDIAGRKVSLGGWLTFEKPTGLTSTDLEPWTMSTGALLMGPVHRCCSRSLAWSRPNSTSAGRPIAQHVFAIMRKSPCPASTNSHVRHYPRLKVASPASQATSLPGECCSQILGEGIAMRRCLIRTVLKDKTGPACIFVVPDDRCISCFHK